MEIAAYAAELAGITDLKLFERHGKPVCEKKITEEEVTAQILKELRVQPDGYETAAVLTITDQEAWKMAAILKKSWEMNRLPETSDSSRFKKGITVTTFYLAKGLEFDQVFTVWGRLRKTAGGRFDPAGKIYLCNESTARTVYVSGCDREKQRQ